MNTQITSASNNTVGLLNLESFELSQRIAKMLSSSTLVPEQYRATIKVKSGKDDYGNQIYREEPNPNGLSNCIIALNMSNRMGADPLMIMQNLYLIEGRPAWSSQFIMAAINTCGRFSSLRFEFEDKGEKEVEYQETTWVNRKKQTTTKTMKIQNWTCYAWVIEKGSVNPDGTPVVLKSSVISMEMAIKEGWYQKSGSKWQTMPEQMLRYRAASFFGRVYAPELLMGLRSVEEEQDRVIDVTPGNDAPTSVQKDMQPVKNAILKAKTIDELDELSFEVDGFEGKDRKDLDKLLNAQYKKFAEPNKAAEPIEAEAVEIKQPENVQNQTSNEAADGELSVDELKRLQQEAEALVQQKQPASGELRRAYAKALNTAKSLADVLDIEEQIENDGALNQGDAQYLVGNIEEVRAKFEASQAPAVDPLKSGSVKSGLILLISDAKNGEDLRQVAQKMNAAKPNLTSEHQQELLQAYQQKKKLIEDQMDMFPNK